VTGEISRRTALQTAAALAAAGCIPEVATEHAAAGPALPASPTGVVQPSELAHYYRFQEIVEGRELVQTAGVWNFTGPAIPFDPDGVHPVIDDPDTSALPEGSPQRQASEECDRAYTKMLHALNRVFDGHPDELGHVSRLMFALEEHARHLMSFPSAPGAETVLGPAFRLLDESSSGS
jgi:hypothetical protein